MHAIYTTFFGREKKVTKLVLIENWAWGWNTWDFRNQLPLFKSMMWKRMKHEDRMTLGSQHKKKHSVEIDYPKWETASLESVVVPLGKVGIIILASHLPQDILWKCMSQYSQRELWKAAVVSESQHFMNGRRGAYLSKAIILIRMSLRISRLSVNHLERWHSSNLLYLHKH